MIRSRAEIVVTQSLWDRLTVFREEWVAENKDWPTTRAASLKMYREGVEKDVERLLNTRKPHLADIDSFPEVAKSALNYGVPDLTEFSGMNSDPAALLLKIQQALENFEKRIERPRVRPSRTPTRSDMLRRSLNFSVEGSLKFDDGQELIVFDTVLEITSGNYKVK